MPIRWYLAGSAKYGTLQSEILHQNKTFNTQRNMASTTVSEKPYRSIIKATSWRAIGTFDTMLISFFITGNVKFAVSIGGVELFTKMFLYFLHERLWNKIKFGRVEKKEIDYQI
ncbi:MAG: DUF2061 domain-containing protein [Bacteroidales bacterium]